MQGKIIISEEEFSKSWYHSNMNLNFKKDLNIRGQMETNAAFFVRLLILSISLLGLVSLLLSVMSLSLFLILKTVNRVHSRYRQRVTVQGAMRNGLIMNIMSHFPYSTFMLQL